jgi:hypothetical protein
MGMKMYDNRHKGENKKGCGDISATRFQKIAQQGF